MARVVHTRLAENQDRELVLQLDQL
jgi:hypothetical protein